MESLQRKRRVLESELGRQTEEGVCDNTTGGITEQIDGG